MYVNVRELPRCVREVLKKVGYKKKEISYSLDERISLQHSASLRYNRGFTAIIDLISGKYRIGLGSFGGTNQFQKTIVDDCTMKFKFPASFVILCGEHGNGGNLSTMTMRPDGALALVGSEDDIEDRLYKILKIYKKVTGDQRDDLLCAVSPYDIREALKIGYLSQLPRNLFEYRLTKRGKVFVKRYEEDFPHKIYLI